MSDFIERVVLDSIWYAEKYGMTFSEALKDWEGDGPNGSWGLTTDEREAALAYYEREC
jgi:hypothetical protein